uniref:Ras family protein n=1 Tax=Steinernema glaseri TaxID=37863 RepID=A0A1I7Y3S8_9BILA
MVPLQYAPIAFRFMRDRSTTSKVKVVILGDAGVGKTALLNRFIFDRYEHDYKFTVGADFYEKTVDTRNGNKVRLEIWDTAGHERFHSILPSIVREANAAVLVYDVTDEASFHSIAFWKMFVKMECRLDPFLVLVGTKADSVKQRKVAHSSLRSYAGDVSFLETSAKTGLNVDAVVCVATLIIPGTSNTTLMETIEVGLSSASEDTKSVDAKTCPPPSRGVGRRSDSGRGTGESCGSTFCISLTVLLGDR